MLGFDSVKSWFFRLSKFFVEVIKTLIFFVKILHIIFLQWRLFIFIHKKDSNNLKIHSSWFLSGVLSIFNLRNLPFFKKYLSRLLFVIFAELIQVSGHLWTVMLAHLKQLILRNQNLIDLLPILHEYSTIRFVRTKIINNKFKTTFSSSACCNLFTYEIRPIFDNVIKRRN